MGVQRVGEVLTHPASSRDILHKAVKRQRESH